MRLSVDKRDPGHHPQAYYCQPYIDGKKADNIVTIDFDRKYWVELVTDENGNVMIDPDNPSEAKRRRVEFGDRAVEVRVK